MLKRRAFNYAGVSIDMTPMIDIVFQLLAFFIFTLRILQKEGDLGIQMPVSSAPGPSQTVLVPPLQIKLTAAPDGSLAGIRLNEQAVQYMPALRARIVDIIGESEHLAGELEADLRCDEGLAYQHTMDALTAISGRRDASGRIEPLVRKVRFR